MDHQRPLTIHWVDSTDSPEFTHLNWALTRSSLIGLDAEWKPLRGHQSTFPTVSLLQIACRLASDSELTHQNSSESLVFLLDLASIHLPSIYELLKGVFVSHDVIKLGFKFKQDLVYLSSTFCSQGCDPGFEKVEPFLDITSIYHHLHYKQSGRKLPKQNKSLATICKEMLGISLSKELQCSDWSQRPLTEAQKTYAAADAQCLLKIFDIFNAKIDREGTSSNDVGDILSSNLDLGLKQILDMPNSCEKIVKARFNEASDMVRATITQSNQTSSSVDAADSLKSCSITKKLDKTLLKIVRKYGDKLVLKDSDRNPKRSKKKVKKSSATLIAAEDRQVEDIDNWQGPPPWDLSMGGDGYPKFLCDVMVEGLAKQLRCVGIDAAVPYMRKPETRDLIEQASREKRVLITRDSKLMRHEYLLKNQIYRIKSLLKNEQLLEVIETFQLKISEDQLMSRCTKCNGMFIHKPLSTEEAIRAAKGFQKIPNCLFNKNLEFWQCKDCNQLYWEGTQYHNAVQKFINICKLNDQPDGCDA